MKFYIEQSAFSGVVKIAGRVAQDVALVTDKTADVVVSDSLSAAMLREAAAKELTIAVATLGRSELPEQFGVPTDQLEGKNECYGWFFPEAANQDNLLLIVGSDKRGTIYGMFHLSEIMGVSPFVDWCGVMPPHQEEVKLHADMACISKEPSVRFRGFFINDEWPAFGNWSEHHFGGPNAKAYEHIFELLLRMKGNYLWPAMWSARFEDDGPGLLNAELADEYGVVMGMSHHEPCLRQGEEYKYLRGKDSIYGDAWNFRTNREGITRFWEDGLKRSGRFENVITVGMRGEADTAIMGKNATLGDNIELLRDVLKTQRRLIQENVNEDLTKVPRMIALYKEVEEFFYGNETTKGLIGSKELEDVILMLCDDNFGNLRTLPTEEMRKHPGGYGMYYHFDYHGWPTSYEWINSSYLPKIWEQMTMAYDFGVRDLWIVNVGDIATQEFPLSFFLDLAYDFEEWGTSAPNTTDAYVAEWTEMQFGRLPEDERKQIAAILESYTRVIHKCRPEAIKPQTYHAVHYRESDRVLAEADEVMNAAKAMYKRIEKEAPEMLSAYVALVYYPAMGTMNVLKLNLLAGKNQYFAKLGATCANDYADEVLSCMQEDERLVEQYHQMDGQRWYGMGLSQHIGFTNWNEDECQNPLLMRVIPLKKKAVIATVDGTSQHTEGGPWLNHTLTVDDFLDPECKKASVSFYSRGSKPSEFKITDKPEWILTSAIEGTVDESDKAVVVELTLDEAKLAKILQNGETVGTITVELPAGVCEFVVPVNRKRYDKPTNTFIDTKGFIAMEAEHYSKCVDGVSVDGQPMHMECLKNYGKTLSAMKAYPSTAYASLKEKAPYVEYQIQVKQAGDYEAELYMQPSNPVKTDNKLEYALQINEGEKLIVNAIEENYKVGDDAWIWGRGVLDQIRRQSTSVYLEEGSNSLRVYPVTPGFVLEKIVLYPKGNKPAEAYFGPEETYRCK